MFLIAFLVIHFVENKWKAFFVSTTVYLVVSFIYLPYKYNANWNELNLTWLSISNFLSETAAEYIGTFLLSFVIHYATIGTYRKYKKKKQKEFDDWVRENSA